MARIFHMPVYGPRIVPFGQARQSTDVIPRTQDVHGVSHPSFRITQRFTDPDVFNGYRPHNAIDLGNYYCGESVLAMLRGTCHLLRDPSGALGVQINHPNGWISQYWHLMRWNVKEGQSVYRGRRIGWVGSTGLDIGGCHLHVVTINPDGHYVDPAQVIQNRV